NIQNYFFTYKFYSLTYIFPLTFRSMPFSHYINFALKSNLMVPKI
ncbi:hypothetical protein KSS87_015849, partial [Heliosperma pusillum]